MRLVLLKEFLRDMHAWEPTGMIDTHANLDFPTVLTIPDDVALHNEGCSCLDRYNSHSSAPPTRIPPHPPSTSSSTTTLAHHLQNLRSDWCQPLGVELPIRALELILVLISPNRFRTHWVTSVGLVTLLQLVYNRGDTSQMRTVETHVAILQCKRCCFHITVIEQEPLAIPNLGQSCVVAWVMMYGQRPHSVLAGSAHIDDLGTVR
jgi:hypothetical protein